jgi:peptide/nickel transport system substrate-binding protein
MEGERVNANDDQTNWAEKPLSRRRLLYIGGGLGLAVAVGGPLAACGGTTEDAEQDVIEPDATTREATTIAVPNDMGGWDFDYLAFNLVGIMVLKNTYPFAIDYGVTEIDGAPWHDTDSFVNVYAESFESSEDGRVWTLKLREGLTWPRSGNEITAEDVKWSKDRGFAAQANVAGIYRLIGLTEPDQVEVVDRYTVRFHQEVASTMTEQIQIISLFFNDSQAAQENANSEDEWAQDWINNTPQDGGAYSVVSHQRNQEIVLEANPNWPPGEAPTKNVRLIITPAAESRRLQLERGDIDIAMGLGRRDIEDLRGREGITVITVPGNEFTAVPLSVETLPLDDARVRQALAHAVPYQQIIDNVFFGEGRRSTSLVPLDMPGHIEDGYPYDYDIERAQALMTEAGQEGGFSTELAIEADNPEQQQIAILLQNEFRNINVELRINQLDPATFSERRGRKDIPMQVTSGQMWVNDVEYLLAVTLTEGAFLNYSNYVNPRIMEIFGELRGLTDSDRRMEYFAEVQRILAEDVPMLMLGQPNFNLPVRDTIAGWVQPVDGLGRLYYLGGA